VAGSTRSVELSVRKKVARSSTASLPGCVNNSATSARRQSSPKQSVMPYHAGTA
jgi:hypothetical protein